VSKRAADGRAWAPLMLTHRRALIVLRDDTHGCFPAAYALVDPIMRVEGVDFGSGEIFVPPQRRRRNRSLEHAALWVSETLTPSRPRRMVWGRVHGATAALPLWMLDEQGIVPIVAGGGVGAFCLSDPCLIGLIWAIGAPGREDARTALLKSVSRAISLDPRKR